MQVGIFCLMWVICAPLLLGSSSNMDTDNNKKELKKDPQKNTNPKELTSTARIIPLLCHFYCNFMHCVPFYVFVAIPCVPADDAHVARVLAVTFIKCALPCCLRTDVWL